MAETLRIRFRKRDGILISWRNAVANQNDRGLLSFLFKKAIIHYINTGDTICVGKIYLPDRILIEEKNSLNVFIGDAPEIIDFVSRNAKASSNLMREILKQSIQIAERMEEQWVPTYLDIEKMERAHNPTMPARPVTPIPAIGQSKKAADTCVVKRSSAPPKAAALFGRD